MAKGTLNITSDGIGSAEITDASIVAVDLAANSVTTEEVSDTTIVTLTCGTTNTSTTVTAASTTGMIVGAAVSGAGILAAAYVVSIITNTSFVLSAAATATASVTLTFDSGITSKKLAQNLTLTGDYVGIPSATTTQRDALTAADGMLVYNTTLAVMQQRAGGDWKSIASSPSIVSIAPTTADQTGESIVITGTNFSPVVTVKIIGNNATVYTPASVTRNTSAQITITTPAGILVANEPYDIKVTNSSGLSATLENALDAGGIPAWTTAAGSLGTVIEDEVMTPITVVATDPDAASTIAYSFATGSTPIAGVALGSANGQLTGTPNAGGSSFPVTHNFDLRATDLSGNTTDRSFSLIRTLVEGVNSIRFDDGDGSQMTQTISAGNRQRWTFSAWIKKGDQTADQRIFACEQSSATTYITVFKFIASGAIQFADNAAGSNAINLISNHTFNDVGQWYHFVVAIDTTQNTTSNRARIYVNGEDIKNEVGGYATETYCSQNYNTFNNQNGNKIVLGSWDNNNNQYFDGYMSDVYYVDGTQQVPTDFAEIDHVNDYQTIGHWKPKPAAVTFGTNGFHLRLEDSAAIGNDVSGQNNDFTVNNISVYDSIGEASYDNTFCTLNPLKESYNNASTQLHTKGNLDFHAGTTSGWRDTAGTVLLPTSGKWYWECCNSVGLTSIVLGLMEHGRSATTGAVLDTTGFSSGGWYSANGQGRKNGSNSGAGTWSSWTTALDVVGQAYDAATGEFWFAKNGTWQNSGNPVAGTGEVMTLDNAATKPMCIALGQASASASRGAVMNFGQDSTFSGLKTAQNNADSGGIGDFYYTPPTGFKAICTKNLPAPPIQDAGDHFNTVLYAGDNGGSHTISGLAFQPDFVWIKQRNGTENHALFDVIRGAGWRLMANHVSAQNQNASGYLTGFNSTGFVVGTDGAVNQSSYNYKAFCWKAGGTASTNTNGSRNSEVSANQTAGFSIVKWEGTGASATIGHGLSKAPEALFVKNYDAGNQWMCNIASVTYGSQTQVILNDGAAGSSPGGTWGAITATTFNVLTNGDVNANNQSIVAYCWHSVEGYSKVGTYRANDHLNGTFVYTGFKPAFIIVKNVANSQYWLMKDNKTDVTNPKTIGSYPNDSAAEFTSTGNLDFLSNGFKLRTTDNSANQSTDEFFYMCFAERPFKYARGE